MLRQTPSSLKVLTRAYRAVLREMHRKNFRLALAASIAASGVVLTPSARACEECGDPYHIALPEADSFFAFDALYSVPYSAPAVPPAVAAASGGAVYAGAAQADTRHGTQRGLIIYVHDQGTSNIDSAIWSGATTMRQYANSIADDQRRWVAANSGGRLDIRYDIADGAIGLNPATGQKWGGGLDTVNHLIAQAGLTKSNYAYVQLIWDHMYSSQYVNTSGGTIGLGDIGNGSGTKSNWSEDYSRTHELGHNLGFGHAGCYDSAGGGYAYDFATKQYVAKSWSAPSKTSNITPTSIGVLFGTYGNPVDIMGHGATLHYNPRDKLSVGWLGTKHFQDLGSATTASASATVRVHDHQSLQAVTRGDGAAMEYGVAQGYSDVPYAATFARRAQKFVPNGTNDGGSWQYYIQTVDLYYVPTGVSTYGLEMRVDGVYLGVIQLGQSINEKDIGNYLYFSNGTDLVTGLHAAAPDNPDRYRSTKYTLNFASSGSDSAGSYANLQVTANVGVTASGLRIDASSASGAQNGDAAWSAGVGRWYDIDNAANNAVWTDGARAVIGGGTGAAGTVTISGTVAAKGITFDNGNGASHTLTGGTLALADEGLIAVESATIASDLRYDGAQIWDVARGKTVSATGAVTHNGNSFSKLGSGTVSFSAADALSVGVGVHEGTVVQLADAAPTSLYIAIPGTYRVEGGTLALTQGKSVTGQGKLVLATAASDNNAPALWLGKGIGSGDYYTTSGTVGAAVVLESGMQVIRTNTGFLAQYDSLGNHPAYDFGSAQILGDISGAGGFALYADHNNAELVLRGTNTFAGGIEMRRGMLTPIGSGALPNGVKLTFNTASGDLARFYLRGVDRSISDLSSTGAGSAVIANSTGANSYYAPNSTPGAATLFVTQNNDGTFSGTITDTNNGAGAPGGYGPSGSAGALGLTKLGAATLTLSGSNTYTGATTVSAGTLRLGSASALPSGTALAVNGTGTLDLADNNTTVASLSGTGAGAITLGTATLTAGGNNASTAFSGTISGTGGLIKAGAGKLTLSGQNTYTGATRINAGALAIDFSAASVDTNLIAAASVLQLNGGTLEVTGKAGATNAQSFASTSLLAGSNSIRLVQNGAASLDLNLGTITRTAGTIDFSGFTGAAVGARILVTNGTANGLLDGGAAWSTVNGGDWAAKDATNTYVVAYANYADVATGGGIVPNTPGADIRIIEGGAGPVSLGASTTAVNSILMRAGTSAGVIATAGKTLETGAISVASTAQTLTVGAAAGDGTLTSGTGSLMLLSNFAPASGALTVNASIANKGATPLALTASGGANSGTVILAADNSYTGGTTLTNGVTLQVGAGAGAGSLGTGAVVLNAGTHLVVNRTGTLGIAGVISGAGDLTQSGSGTTVLTGANTYSGGTTVSAGTLQVGTGGSLGTGGVTVASGATLEFDRTDSATVSAAISGAGAIVKRGAGTVTLGAANTITGLVTIDAGTLAFTVNNQLGTASVQINSGGTLGFSATSGGPTLANVITGAGTLAKSGASNLFLGNSALTGFTGTLSISAGNVIANQLGSVNGQYGLNLAGGVFTLSDPFVGNTATIGNLSGTGGTINAAYNATVGVRTLGVNQTTNATYAGVLSDSGSRQIGLSKDGSASLTLSGNNAYSGGTTVNGGTLIAARNTALGSGAVAVNSGGRLNTGLTGTAWTIANAITVNSGGTLMGVATHTGAVTINTGGTLAPGNSPGIATFSGGLTFDTGSAYAWEFVGNSLATAGTDYDQIVISGGTLNIASGALLKFTASGVNYAASYWDSGHSFLIADAQGFGNISGTFTADTSAAGAFAGRGAWSLNYASGDVYAVWTAIPEPSTYGLLGAGALAFAASLRRRSRRAA